MFSTALLAPALNAAQNWQAGANPDKPVLTLSWHNAAGQLRSLSLTLTQLQALPQHSLRLQLPMPLGIEQVHEWRGVSLNELLQLSDSTGSELRVQALNGYFARLPRSDIERYNPLLASHRDGVPLSIRDKGPLMLIYPFDQFNELNQQIYMNRSVWQINEIRIE